MTSILQISDIQFGVEDTDALSAFQKFARTINLDLCLICGDITQNGKTEEFKAAQNWITDLPGPKLITPGNHDTPMFNVFARAFAPFRRYNTYLKPLSVPHFADENIMIVTHNTARGLQLKMDWSLGVVDLDRLKLDMDALRSVKPGTLKMIAVHHPFLYPKGAPLQKTTKNGPEAIRRLSNNNIDGVLSGHVHAPFMIARELGETGIMSIGSGTLSLRTRGKPASFNHIEIDETSIKVTAYSWMSNEYNPQHVWTTQRSELALNFIL